MSHFKGQIEKVKPKHICFKRIFISGMYTDGTMFDGKEDHVWMDKSGFEECAVGDSVSFCAEVYRYVKTGNGKLIDYGLRNPTGIQKIEAYELPSDDELIMQEVEQLICETCFLSEQCNRNEINLPACGFSGFDLSGRDSHIGKILLSGSLAGIIAEIISRNGLCTSINLFILIIYDSNIHIDIG